VQTVGREFGWDFERNLVTLALSGNAANVLWQYEYVYPSNGVEIYQLIPSIISDANDPLPINYLVGNTLVASVQTKVIWANLQNALAYYANNPTETTWDPGFREAVVRLLASELSLAVAGKPDFAESLMEQAGTFANMGAGRPD
jgi:hypothetical protein